MEWTLKQKETWKRWKIKMKKDPERYQKYLEKKRKEHKRYCRKLRMGALTQYGGNPPKCACCGESCLEFLTIDHINGNGKVHRMSLSKQKNPASYVVWLDLRRRNYPPGFRVLCMNCNFSFGHHGYCPHQRKKKGVGQ